MKMNVGFRPIRGTYSSSDLAGFTKAGDDLVPTERKYSGTSASASWAYIVSSPGSLFILVL